MLVMIPLSFIGEVIASPCLRLYDYRGGSIPFYIPFGHAVVYATCTMLAGLPEIVRQAALIRRVLSILLIASLLGVGVVLGDTLSLFFGLLTVVILQLKGWDPFYLLMAVIVFAIELIGTSYGCWAWRPDCLCVLHSANPPLGAVYIYVVGDMVVQYLADRLHRTPSSAATPNSAEKSG
jgi:hypothetical protein